MGLAPQRNIDLTFMSGNGRFLARVTGEAKGNVTLRKQQYRISEDKEKSVQIARNFILGKVYNSRWVLERATRDYALRLDIEKMKKKSAFLAQSTTKIRECESAEELLGLEGEAASVYFSVFDDLILQQKADFYFQGRNKRPPLDNVNAMLSFAYSLLAGMCGSAVGGCWIRFVCRIFPYRSSGQNFSCVGYHGRIQKCDGGSFCIDIN